MGNSVDSFGGDLSSEKIDRETNKLTHLIEKHVRCIENDEKEGAYFWNRKQRRRNI
jgi:hypothetical protein